MDKEIKQLHVVMFPWFAYGHVIPFVHLSNKLAENGHRISFLLPHSVQVKISSLILYPKLIKLYTLTIPKVHGLPPNAETTADLPMESYHLLFNAFDQTQDQVGTMLTDLSPHIVFYDLAYWVSSLKPNNPKCFKTVVYQVVNAAMLAYTLVPLRMMLTNHISEADLEGLKKPPQNFPNTNIKLSHYEAFKVLLMVFKREEEGDMSFYERTTKVVEESDGVALMTCNELEGKFSEYLREEYKKPVLLTGPILPPTSSYLEEKWASWLNKFDVGSVVYCSIGSQVVLEKNQFQELVLGFEMMGLPFLVALSPPKGCNTIEEALPNGFKERVNGRGWVYGGWVPQPQILSHPSIGCFVGHCGLGCMWEALYSNCQIVLIPQMVDHYMGAKLMVEELQVAVLVQRGEHGWVSKENLCNVVKLVMDEESQVAKDVKANHTKLREIIFTKDYEDYYIKNFIDGLRQLLD